MTGASFSVCLLTHTVHRPLFYQTPFQNILHTVKLSTTQPQCYGDLQTQEASTVIILMLSWLIMETERGRAMVRTLHSKQRPEACVDRGLPCFVSWLLHAQLGNAASLGILDVWYVFYSFGLWDASSKAFFWCLAPSPHLLVCFASSEFLCLAWLL